MSKEIVRNSFGVKSKEISLAKWESIQAETANHYRVWDRNSNTNDFVLANNIGDGIYSLYSIKYITSMKILY